MWIVIKTSAGATKSVFDAATVQQMEESGGNTVITVGGNNGGSRGANRIIHTTSISMDDIIAARIKTYETSVLILKE